MAVGLTVILLVVAPLFHWYVVAPLAVNVTGCPAQTDVLVLLTVTVGGVPTTQLG